MGQKPRGIGARRGIYLQRFGHTVTRLKPERGVKGDENGVRKWRGYVITLDLACPFHGAKKKAQLLGAV